MRPAAVVAAALCLSAVLVYTANGDSDGLGNGVYTVFVEDQQQADGAGTFTILTGPDHPAGEGQEVLFNQDGPGDAATSYLTVRSYTTGVDYVQALGEQYSGNIVYPLDSFATVQSSGSGHNVTYTLSEYDALTITSSTAVSPGGDFEDASVTLTLDVRNNGAAPVELGMRFLLDLAPVGDDGPLVATHADPAGLARETTFAAFPPGVNVFPNDVDSEVAFGLIANGPSPVLKFASWSEAFDSAFDYITGDLDIASEGGLNDGALAYYFGATVETAITVAPQRSLTVWVQLTAPLLLTTTEICDNDWDDDADTLLDGRDPDCATPTPVPTPAPEGPPTATPGSLPNTGAKPRQP